MSITLIGSIAVGLVLFSRVECFASRLAGLCFLILAFLFAGKPAFADQTVMAADSAQVDCHASARDLTRISLVDDQFASVSKISSGNPGADFSVVNEPVRGDIYLSVPDGFAKPALSFFGTSKRGYVYKFVCRIQGDQALQVFVANPAIAKEQQAQNGRPDKVGPQDAAVMLIQAMAQNNEAEGYERRQRSFKPVTVGDLQVQMIAEYRGENLSGQSLRIENLGKKTVALDDKTIAPSNALAISIAQPHLEPGQATTAYLVSRNGRP